MLLDIQRINVPPGQRVLLQDVTWPELEEILSELGDQRAARIAYNHGTLEIMTPLPEHEFSKEIIGDLLKALLEELDMEFISLGSTTFKNMTMTQGIEPDQCFYIHNEQRVRGHSRIDLAIDPPPDLALEIDVTSRTHLDVYLGLQVPELWRFDRGELGIYLLKTDGYQQSTTSPNFPGLPLLTIIPEYLRQSRSIGRNKAIKAFRAWVRSTNLTTEKS
jgi:Uma2 family endonuclease